MGDRKTACLITEEGYFIHTRVDERSVEVSVYHEEVTLDTPETHTFGLTHVEAMNLAKSISPGAIEVRHKIFKSSPRRSAHLQRALSSLAGVVPSKNLRDELNLVCVSVDWARLSDESMDSIIVMIDNFKHYFGDREAVKPSGEEENAG